MSDIETVKGKLQKICYSTSLEENCIYVCAANGIIELDQYIKSFAEQIIESLSDKYIIINRVLYEFLERKYIDPSGFAEVQVNSDNTIDFFVSWYNGGGCLSDVLEYSLKEE